MDELDQIMDRAMADGLSDEDIQFIVGEWKVANPPTPSPGAQARQQSQERPADYLREMAGNVPGDLWQTGKDVVGGTVGALGTLAGATSEVGSAAGNAMRELVGLEPHYGGTENIEKVAAFPGQIIDHYKQYLDPEQRALMVRDRPIGVVADVAGVVGAGRGAMSKTDALGKTVSRRPVGVITDVIRKHPQIAAEVAGATVGGMVAGHPGAVAGAAGGGLLRAGITRMKSGIRGVGTPDA